jgi:methenyltetrahydromethanopterin cyclohydrolase
VNEHKKLPHEPPTQFEKKKDDKCGPTQQNIHFIQHPVFSSQSAGSVDITEIFLASRRASLHDFMALSYGPARALAYL